MKKSIVFTFGVLVSSLVMLAVMPLLNQNNSFSNTAMAQGYDDDYYGDSYYSTYQTDDKKYECRTGPLEGFFVSSVEFCKIKFDDRKDIRDNRTGTQGPPSPQGPPGATGATGPQGDRGLTGATGLTGPAGEDGMDGEPGPRGFNGTDGAQGPPGIVNAELCPPMTTLKNVYVLNGTTAESCNLVLTCFDCFESSLTPDEFEAVQDWLATTGTLTIENYCTFIAQGDETVLRDELTANVPELTVEGLNALIECLKTLGRLVN